MPLRPPACCKAVQRQLFTPSDSIWLSDEVLSAAFQRFCSLSRTSRRYGSSVPGPLESRRRLGKRRMTHVSEGVPSPSYNPGSIWSSFWDSDRTQWQWQAPTPRPSDQDKSQATLPAWLLEWDTTSPRSAKEPADVEAVHRTPIESTQKAQEDIRIFRKWIRIRTRRHDIQGLVADFSIEFKRSLTLGLISHKTLFSALQCIPKDLMEAWPNKKTTSYWCLRFYTSVWEGIAESKVLGPMEIPPHIMNLLFSLVVSLPLSRGMQGLTVNILRSVSQVQLRCMHRNITSLVEKWSGSWLGDLEAGDCSNEMRSVETLVAAAEEKILNARTLVVGLTHGPDYEPGLVIAQEAISSARAAVAMGIDATVQADDIILPLRASAKALAQALERLPEDLICRLVPSWSTRFIQVSANKEQSFSHRYHWLCTVAQMSNVNERLLVRTWRQMDPLRLITTFKCSEIFLSHWISQGKVRNAPAVRNTFSVSLSSPMGGRSVGFAKLLLSLEKHREKCWTRAGELFDLLYKLRRQDLIPDTLYRMSSLDMKIPTSMLGAGIEKMSAHDSKKALDMFCVPHDMRVGHSVRPDWIPKFIIATIHDPSIPPAAIWRLLNIPIYDERGRSYQPYFAKPLQWEMIDLIHKMATAFAHSDAWPLRVALQNIEQCMHHLRIHNAPILKELTRAFIHVVVTRSILIGMWVGQERLRYALRLVAEVEGEEIAKEVDKTVFYWRQNILERRDRERREANVLRSAPKRDE